jgi:hypothetical protein
VERDRKRPRSISGPLCTLVLVSAHDRQNAVRDGQISRIGRTNRFREVMVVNLEEVVRCAEINGAEAVLAVRIVIRRERIESADRTEQFGQTIGRKARDARCRKDSASKCHAAAKTVVEAADLFGVDMSSMKASPVSFGPCSSRSSGEFQARRIERPGKRLHPRDPSGYA